MFLLGVYRKCISFKYFRKRGLRKKRAGPFKREKGNYLNWRFAEPPDLIWKSSRNKEKRQKSVKTWSENSSPEALQRETTIKNFFAKNEFSTKDLEWSLVRIRLKYGVFLTSDDMKILRGSFWKDLSSLSWISSWIE